MAFVIVLLFAWGNVAEAASLYLSPATGVHQANSTFSVRVMVNTQGQSINAADASLSFNPRELSVVSVNRSSSIFNLWVTEPTFSNSVGSINFSGGLPSGYSGTAGTVMTITFRAVGSGTARVNFSNGSVLANDGRGTNVLTTMNGGTYTIQSASLAPEPEVIEYVAPANTPSAPTISSNTHPDPTGWSNSQTAELNWTVPSDVTAVRTLLNEDPTSIPTKVYDTPIRSITLEDLPEGESYFHIQFQNNDGWGRVTHYRLGVDTKAPTSFTITQSEDNDFSNPTQTLLLRAEDETSAVRRFKIKIDANEPYEFIDETGSSTLTLPALDPGYHTVIIEAFDEAGNSIVDSYSFTIQAFDRPIFIEYPTELNEEVIPVIRGETRPNADVEVTLQKIGSEPRTYQVRSLDNGTFTFIPEGTFTQGVYELSAVATDSFGAMSERSEIIKIAVQQPGYVRIGGMVVSVLSIIIPLLAIVILGAFGLWYLVLYLARFRSKVSKESAEALDILHREFSNLQTILRNQESELQASRKNKKLTVAEAEMIETIDRALQASQSAVEKEIVDVRKLSKNNNHD
jgi:hypothetical protein